MAFAAFCEEDSPTNSGRQWNARRLQEGTCSAASLPGALRAPGDTAHTIVISPDLQLIKIE